MWIDLEKPESGSLGFSLTGGMKGGKTTILVKTITPDGIADKDGRLKIGDRILQVMLYPCLQAHHAHLKVNWSSVCMQFH